MRLKIGIILITSLLPILRACSNSKGEILGIDLRKSYSLIGVYRQDQQLPKESYALLFRKWKTNVEMDTNKSAFRVIVSVPPYFNDEQRSIIKSTAADANLRVERLVNEPTLAMYAYGLKCDGKVITVRVEGNSLDVSLLDIEDGVVEIFETSRTYYLSLDYDIRKLLTDAFINVLKSWELSRDEINEIVLIGSDSRNLNVRHAIKSFFGGIEPLSSIDPDNVILDGMRNLADFLEESFVCYEFGGERSNSLGVEMDDGKMAIIIPRYSLIPVKRTETFVIRGKKQSTAIRIVEGECEMDKDNFLLWEYQLGGVDATSKEDVKIEVSFEIDPDLNFNVVIVNINTGDVYEHVNTGPRNYIVGCKTDNFCMQYVVFH